jgi:hypothetical protein
MVRVMVLIVMASVQHLVFLCVLWCPPPIKLATTINTITLTIQFSILFNKMLN